MDNFHETKLVFFISQVKCVYCSSIYFRINSEGKCPKGCGDEYLLLNSIKREISFSSIMSNLLEQNFSLSKILEALELSKILLLLIKRYTPPLDKTLSNPEIKISEGSSLIQESIERKIQELQNLLSLLDKYLNNHLLFNTE